MLIKSPIYIMAIFVLSLYLMPFDALAQKFPDGDYDTKKCEDCHLDPEYSKEDAESLKQCMVCHGVAGHPYKETLQAKEIITYTDKLKILGDKDLKNMTLIPEGEFLMGTFERHADEGPLHVVYLKGFYIDNYEVTNKNYKEFVDATGHNKPDHWFDNSKEGIYDDEIKDHPVVYVDWYDAQSYCKWRGKKLPREWQWEKAARGTDGRTYPWGNDFDEAKSNNPIAESEGTIAVGSFPQGISPYGLFDMSGNVWEWIDEEYHMHPGSDNLSSEESLKHKTLKGGSWWSCSFYNCGTSAPTYNRSFFSALTKNKSSGLRCVVDEDEVKNNKHPQIK